MSIIQLMSERKPIKSTGSTQPTRNRGFRSGTNHFNTIPRKVTNCSLLCDLPKHKATIRNLQIHFVTVQRFSNKKNFCKKFYTSIFVDQNTSDNG